MASLLLGGLGDFRNVNWISCLSFRSGTHFVAELAKSSVQPSRFRMTSRPLGSLGDFRYVNSLGSLGDFRYMRIPSMPTSSKPQSDQIDRFFHQKIRLGFEELVTVHRAPASPNGYQTSRASAADVVLAVAHSHALR